MESTRGVESLSGRERMLLAEAAESAFMLAFAAGAPPDARAALGMSHHRVGGGVVLPMAADPTGGYWSKALGFGLTVPVTDEVVGEVVAIYRAAGEAVAALQVAPDALPEDWEDICGRHGLVRGSTWVKLLRPAALGAPPASTDQRVGPVGPADSDAWGRTFCVGFGMPEDPDLLALFGSATKGSNGFRPAETWAGGRGPAQPVAAHLAPSRLRRRLRPGQLDLATQRLTLPRRPLARSRPVPFAMCSTASPAPLSSHRHPGATGRTGPCGASAGGARRSPRGRTPPRRAGRRCCS